MELILERKYRKNEYSIGNLYIDGVFFCNTLEPVDKEIYLNTPSNIILQKKVNGKTAIPYGKYRIVVDYSPKFKQNRPRLHSVSGFQGILIHEGNTVNDTQGCILVGKNSEVGKVLNSKDHLRILMGFMEKQENITIEIVKEFKK